MGKHSQNTNKRDILNFIKCMNEKNYAEANKYLHAALEDKMKIRIAEGGLPNKPDHIDADDDGDKKEPMKKAFRDKKKAVSKKKTTKFGKQLQKWADDDS